MLDRKQRNIVLDVCARLEREVTCTRHQFPQERPAYWDKRDGLEELRVWNMVRELRKYADRLEASLKAHRI